MDILYIMEQCGTSSIWLVVDLDKWLGFSKLKEKRARNSVQAPFSIDRTYSVVHPQANANLPFQIKSPRAASMRGRIEHTSRRVDRQTVDSNRGQARSG
jgi:hypothetical protein